MMAKTDLQRGAEINNVLQRVARSHNMTLATMRTNCREPRLVRARREAARELRGKGLSLERIGRLLGGLDHSAIVHYLKHEPKRRRELPPLNIPCPDLSGEWAI